VGAKVALGPVNGAGGAEEGNGKRREASRLTKKVMRASNGKSPGNKEIGREGAMGRQMGMG